MTRENTGRRAVGWHLLGNTAGTRPARRWPTVGAWECALASPRLLLAEGGKRACFRAFYVNVEGGKNNVSLDKVFALADALGVDVEELFTGLTR